MKIIIIGGVAAGAKAAAKSKRLLPDSEIHIYTRDKHVSYSACGLPYYIEGNFEDWRKLLIRSVEEFERSGIQIHLLHEVIKILPLDKKITVNNLETNEPEFIEYDKLILATGAEPYVPSIIGVNLGNVYTLKTLEDGIAIREAMLKANHITLIGGGYINIELMEAFLKNDKKVTIIDKAPFLLPVLDEEISSLVQEYMLSHYHDRCQIYTDDTAIEFIGKDGFVKGVLTRNGKGFETDMVVIAAGVKPCVELAEGAGIELGKTGAIKVNSRMETSVYDIYACGDCAEKINLLSNTPVYIPLGSTANKEGRVAAVNVCGGAEDFEGILGSVVTKFFDLNISMTGLSEKYARSVGFDAISVLTTKRDKAGYMPEAQNITIKLIADRRTHRILGAQAIGDGDADKKINTISGGLKQGLTVEDLLDVDLTYAPPFSTSIDILHTAARMLKSKLS